MDNYKVGQIYENRAEDRVRVTRTVKMDHDTQALSAVYVKFIKCYLHTECKPSDHHEMLFYLAGAHRMQWETYIKIQEDSVNQTILKLDITRVPAFDVW